MYASVRKYRNMRWIDEAARRAEKGLAPILKQQPGFSGYCIIDCKVGIAASVDLFDSRESMEAANEKAIAWLAE